MTFIPKALHHSSPSCLLGFEFQYVLVFLGPRVCLGVLPSPRMNPLYTLPSTLPHPPHPFPLATSCLPPLGLSGRCCFFPKAFADYLSASPGTSLCFSGSPMYFPSHNSYQFLLLWLVSLSAVPTHGPRGQRLDVSCPEQSILEHT